MCIGDSYKNAPAPESGTDPAATAPQGGSRPADDVIDAEVVDEKK